METIQNMRNPINFIMNDPTNTVVVQRVVNGFIVYSWEEHAEVTPIIEVVQHDDYCEALARALQFTGEALDPEAEVAIRISSTKDHGDTIKVNIEEHCKWLKTC